MDLEDPRLVVVDLCRMLHARGWAPAAAGGASVRHEGRIYVSPGGVPRERVSLEDLVELDLDGHPVASGRARDAAALSLVPLFMNVYRLRGAGAVIYSQSVSAITAALAVESAFRVTHLDVLTGLRGVRYHDVHAVPVVENAGKDADLADPMADAMLSHASSHAVLVRRRGAFYWGRDVMEATSHAECYEHLFEVAWRMRGLGIDPAFEPT